MKITITKRQEDEDVNILNVIDKNDVLTSCIPVTDDELLALRDELNKLKI